MKCPFFSEFGEWIECPHLKTENTTYMIFKGVDVKARCGRCSDSGEGIGKGGSWCTKMVGKAMLSHKIWIGNDY